MQASCDPYKYLQIENITDKPVTIYAIDSNGCTTLGTIEPGGEFKIDLSYQRHLENTKEDFDISSKGPI